MLEKFINSARQNHFGYINELGFMLEQNMQLSDCAALMRKCWGLSKGPNFEHEVSHLVLGLAWQNDQFFRFLPYQSSWFSEAFAMTLSNTLTYMLYVDLKKYSTLEEFLVMRGVMQLKMS